jgi:methyl-accepting chemotaxis protein
MNKNLRFSHKILLAASLIVIAAFSLFTLYNDYLQRNAIRDDLDSYLREMGSTTANNIQTWLGGRILLTENLGETLALNPEPEYVSRLLEQKALTSSFLAVYFGDTQGAFTIRPDSKMPDGFDPRTRPWYKDALNSNGASLTEPYIDAVTGQMIISIGTPVKKAGQTLGVVGADLTLKTITDSINALEFQRHGLCLPDQRRRQNSGAPGQTLVMKNLKDIYPQDTPPISSDISEIHSTAKTRIVTFAPVKGLGSVNWYDRAVVDKAQALPLSTFRTSAIIATVIAVISIIALLGLLIRLLMRPLHVMTRAMQNIAEGEGDLTRRLVVESKDEFGTLGSAFNHFVERIHTSMTRSGLRHRARQRSGPACGQRLQLVHA